ncbi:MAG: hypothetical protein ACOC8K_08615 [Gemmatimonadota bacterium]
MLLLVPLLALNGLPARGQPTDFDRYTSEQYEEDFDALWHFVRQTYVYFEPDVHRWDTVRERYRAELRDIDSFGEFVALLEGVLGELRDHHAHLGTHTSDSPNLVPSRTDLWGEWEDGRAFLAQVRPGSPADSAGLDVGMDVVSVGGRTVEEAVCRRLTGPESDGCGAGRGRPVPGIGRSTLCWRVVDPATGAWACDGTTAGSGG